MYCDHWQSLFKGNSLEKLIYFRTGKTPFQILNLNLFSLKSMNSYKKYLMLRRFSYLILNNNSKQKNRIETFQIKVKRRLNEHTKNN